MEPKLFSARDESYLLDILIASQDAIAFVEGITYQDFERSKLHQNAVIRPLEIIGEAAGRISNELKSSYPQIPWNLMIGMRNRLIHNYMDVDLQVIWETIHNDLPPLIRSIRKLMNYEE